MEYIEKDFLWLLHNKEKTFQIESQNDISRTVFLGYVFTGLYMTGDLWNLLIELWFAEHGKGNW